MMIVGIVSGGFDPVHRGHIQLLREANEQCDRLIVGLNSDEWLTRKKGKPFMTWEERMVILSALRYVEEVRGFDDRDDTANALLTSVRADYMHSRVIFMNGGDRHLANIPEADTARHLKIETRDGIGGHEKANSSSDLLAGWSMTTAP